MKKLSQKEKIKNDPAYQYTETISLGPWTSYNYLHDPLHLTFVISRYKFVARMLSGKEKVLEIGCGDAIGTPLVAQTTEHVVALDIDKRIIASNIKRLSQFQNIEFRILDIRLQIPKERFEAVYGIDVIEHIDRHLNDLFMKNICRCLNSSGICILGTPNITSEKYASVQSKKYHINLHNYKSLRSLMSKYFKNVFMFSMNDEVVHTGFAEMAHYLFAMGVGVKYI